MKQTIKTSRTAGYLEKVFRALNAYYFERKIDEPIITIQSTPRAYGHVTVGKAWRKGEQVTRELNIGAGTLDRPIENIVATMLHEMCHLWNLQQGIKDCSRGGAYHNRIFRDTAESRDLKISYDPKIGWSITEPTPQLCDVIIAEGWSDIDMSRSELSFTATGKGAGSANGNSGAGISAKPSSTRKYICPCCGMSVRATKAVNIKCIDCDEQLILS